MKLSSTLLFIAIPVALSAASLQGFASRNSTPARFVVAQSTLSKAANKTASLPTWHRDIGPIVYDKCASCHRPGEVAPFSLMSYADAKKRAKQIALVTESKLMPPWKADASYSDLVEHRGLSTQEIELFKRWSNA